MPEMIAQALTRLIMEAPIIGLLIFALYKVWKRSDELLEKRYNEQVVAFREVTAAMISATETQKRFEESLKEVEAVVVELSGTVKENRDIATSVKNATFQLKDAVTNMQGRAEAVNNHLEQCKVLCLARRNDASVTQALRNG